MKANALDRLLSRIRFIAFDFDGVFTDNSVYVFQDGREAVRCSRMDGMGVSLLLKTGFPACVISSEENPVVAARCRKLKIKCVQGCRNKLEALKKELKAHGLSLKDTAFMGNDVNDIECLKAAGLPIVVKDAHPAVMSLAKYVTKARGGKGAVREICDLLMKQSRD